MGLKPLSVIFAAFLIFLEGCTALQESKTPVTVEEYFIYAAQDVLIKMNFDIDKADAENGIVRTRPLSGAQFFEFWRQENISFNSLLLANLQSIRRIVEVDITEEDQQIKVNCAARVQRLSIPDRDVDSTAQAYEMFSQNSPMLQTLNLGPQQAAQMAWIDLGRDSQLELEILERIMKQVTEYTMSGSINIEESDGV